VAISFFIIFVEDFKIIILLLILREIFNGKRYCQLNLAFCYITHSHWPRAISQ